jgi:hypothetical protein
MLALRTGFVNHESGCKCNPSIQTPVIPRCSAHLYILRLAPEMEKISPQIFSPSAGAHENLSIISLGNVCSNVYSLDGTLRQKRHPNNRWHFRSQCPEQDPPKRWRVSSASGGLNLNSTLLWEYEIKKPPQTTRGLFDSVPGTGYILDSSCKLAEIRRHFHCHDRGARQCTLGIALLGMW